MIHPRRAASKDERACIQGTNVPRLWDAVTSAGKGGSLMAPAQRADSATAGLAVVTFPAEVDPANVCPGEDVTPQRRYRHMVR
jgi:hypothetical protein